MREKVDCGTQSAGREQTTHGTRPFAPISTMFSLAVENNRLPVVFGLQPALFFVAGDTVFLFSREKKYGVAKSNRCEHDVSRPHFSFSNARKRKTAAPGEKEKGAGCGLAGTEAPAICPANRNSVQRLQRGHGSLLLFVLSSSACEESGHPSVKSALWYAERRARTNDAWYTPFCTNFHDVFPCGGKEPLAGCLWSATGSFLCRGRHGISFLPRKEIWGRKGEIAAGVARPFPSHQKMMWATRAMTGRVTMVLSRKMRNRFFRETGILLPMMMLPISDI